MIPTLPGLVARQGRDRALLGTLWIPALLRFREDEDGQGVTNHGR